MNIRGVAGDPDLENDEGNRRIQVIGERLKLLLRRRTEGPLAYRTKGSSRQGSAAARRQHEDATRLREEIDIGKGVVAELLAQDPSGKRIDVSLFIGRQRGASRFAVRVDVVFATSDGVVGASLLARCSSPSWISLVLLAPRLTSAGEHPDQGANQKVGVRMAPTLAHV